MSLTYDTLNRHNLSCLHFTSFTFKTQHWFNADRWYRIEFAEDYVNGNTAAGCPVNNGHNFDLMCCPVTLSNIANNLRSGVNIVVNSNNGLVCTLDNDNSGSWYASGAITEFFAHPSNTSSPNYNSNQQNGTYTFGNVVRAHRNTLNTFNFNITSSTANGTIQLHVARPPVLNPIFDINYNLLPNTSLWAANTSTNHNLLIDNNRTFQFSSGLDWQNPLPSVTPVQTAGTTLSIHPSLQTFYNEGYYMGLLVNQIPDNSSIPNCKQLMACVVYIDFEPMNLTVTSASCNDRNTRICGISSTVAQISISTNHGQNWQSYPVNGGCVVLPFHQNQHGNGFTVLVRDPYTCQIYTLNVPSANLRCCESIHFGNNCVSNISNYNYVYLNNPSNQPNQRRKVSMSGDIRINTDVVINNCEIIMLPGSRIWMEAGKKLTITNSHIRACDTLWQGIRTTNATNNNAQIIIDNSTIEDAFSAVEAYSATINVRNSTFRNNYNHLNVILSQIAPLENNIFTCQMNNQANSGRIKPHYLGGHCHNLLPMTPPNTNRVTQTAVSIAWCSNTVIMNNNIFERAYTGLNISDGNYLLGANGINRFRNLYQYGIIGKVFDPQNSDAYLTLIGNQFLNIRNTLPSTFPNLIFGEAIYLTGFNLAASGNQFTNSQTHLPSMLAIHLEQGYVNRRGVHKVYNIQNNIFSRGGMFADIYAFDNPNAEFIIRNNEFLGWVPFNSHAAYIANTFSSTQINWHTTINMTGNIVKNKSNGFYLAQVHPTLVENNLIRLNEFNPNQSRNFGIKVENTIGKGVGEIRQNTVNMMPGNTPTYLHVGIELASAPNMHVANNLVDGLGRGLWFSGNNRFNEIECNRVKDYEMGWVISWSTGLDIQGDITTPQDNQWVINSNQSYFGNGIWEVYKDANSGITMLFIRNGASSIYLPSRNNIILQISSGSQNAYCNAKPGANKEELISGDRVLNAQTLIEAALKRESMEYTYRFLKGDSTLTPDEIAYRDSLDAISVGFYGKLIDSLYQGNVSYTEQMLAQTFCTCPIDESMKKVMQVYSETFAVGIDTFTAGQIDTLMEIAMTPKHLSTRAVISARIMLKTGYDITMDFDTDFTSPKILRNDVVSLAEPIYSQVYPNPAQEILWIECPVGSEIIITDPMGKTYLKTQNQEEIFLVDLQNLPAGLYFVKIINEELVNTHKVVVSK